ncbi:hypothetical protein [Streptosporangium sp. NPDC004631]
MAKGDRADQLPAMMVDRPTAAGLVNRRGRVRADSTHVLAAVRRLNRVEPVGETLRAALEEPAAVNEDWPANLITPEWTQRYARPIRYDRLPQGKEELAAYTLRVGQDGITILNAVYTTEAPPRLRRLPKVRILRQVWERHLGSGCQAPRTARSSAIQRVALLSPKIKKAPNVDRSGHLPCSVAVVRGGVEPPTFRFSGGAIALVGCGMPWSEGGGR